MLGLVIAAATLVLGVALGNVSVPIADTVAIIGHRLIGIPQAVTWPQSAETIVIDLRLPRVLTAMAVGAALSLAGATYQGLLRNPLADPYVLGTASGAALGAAIALIIPVQIALLASACSSSSPSSARSRRWPSCIGCRAWARSARSRRFC